MAQILEIRMEKYIFFCDFIGCFLSLVLVSVIDKGLYVKCSSCYHTHYIYPRLCSDS